MVADWSSSLFHWRSSLFPSWAESPVVQHLPGQMLHMSSIVFLGFCCREFHIFLVWSLVLLRLEGKETISKDLFFPMESCIQIGLVSIEELWESNNPPFFLKLKVFPWSIFLFVYKNITYLNKKVNYISFFLSFVK